MKGFHLGFLLREANAKAAKYDWRSFNAILACCIYDMVLFLNEPKFIDENAITLFIQRNPVPTLLGDVYYSLEELQREKWIGPLLCSAFVPVVQKFSPSYRYFHGYLAYYEVGASSNGSHVSRYWLVQTCHD